MGAGSGWSCRPQMDMLIDNGAYNSSVICVSGVPSADQRLPYPPYKGRGRLVYTNNPWEVPPVVPVRPSNFAVGVW